jgi:hypothetical protein
MADFSLNALDAEIARLEKKIKFGSIGQDIAGEVLTIARTTRSALDMMARILRSLRIAPACRANYEGPPMFAQHRRRQKSGRAMTKHAWPLMRAAVSLTA